MTKIDLKNPEFADMKYGLYGDGTPFRLLPGVGLLRHAKVVKALRQDNVSRAGRGVTRVDCACGAHGAQWVVPGAGSSICDQCLANAKWALKVADEKSPPPGPGPGHLNLSHPALFDDRRPPEGRPVGFDLLVRPKTVAALRSGAESRFVQSGEAREMCVYCCALHPAAWTVPGALFHPCEECLAGAKRLLAEVDADDGLGAA